LLVTNEDWVKVEDVERRGRAARRLAGQVPDVSVERVLVKDRPAASLLDRSGNAQLLVVGSRGRGGLVSALLGFHQPHCVAPRAVPGDRGRSRQGQVRQS